MSCPQQPSSASLGTRTAERETFLSSDVTPVPADVRAGSREWLGLAVLALPTLLLAVDNSVLYLALPQLSAGLQPSSAALMLVLAVLVVTLLRQVRPSGERDSTPDEL